MSSPNLSTPGQRLQPMESLIVTWWIATFFLCGAAFGAATYSRRHLFSEGARRPTRKGERDPLDSRLMWLLMCSCLWPFFAIAGAYSYAKVGSKR